MTITRDAMAARLNGREYRSEITREEVALAKGSGLVVLFGASDDLAEFHGAIEDELGCYDGGTFTILDGELMDAEPDCHCKYAEAAKLRALREGREIKAVWDGDSGYSWIYETDIPHATFDVMEDGGLYCRGIVFALADAGNRKSA